VRAGLAAGTVISTALAVDTLSITIMEVIDNVVVLLVPGAMEAGVGDPLIWASIAAGFVVAYPFAFLANRSLIARGKGHALVPRVPPPLNLDVGLDPDHHGGTTRSACHAEGRGFESHQPLSRRPAFAGLFRAGVGRCVCVTGQWLDNRCP
jgi:hypothetical protein